MVFRCQQGFLDILITSSLLLIVLAGCVNSTPEAEPTEVPASMESEVSENETTTSEATKETATTTSDEFEPDPTYEEAAAHVRELLEEGNSAEEVIAILMDEGKTEFEATALVNSVLMEGDTPTASTATISSGSSSAGSTGSSSSQGSGTSSSGTSSGSDQTPSPTSGGSSGQVQETAPTQTQSTNTGSSEPASVTPAPTSATTTPIPTKVIQTVYMRINWSVDTREAAEAMGINLNDERPEASGYCIMACDENGNYSAASIIDRSDLDAAEQAMYAEADAILAKYGIDNGYYTYTSYKYEIGSVTIPASISVMIKAIVQVLSLWCFFINLIPNISW